MVTCDIIKIEVTEDNKKEVSFPDEFLLGIYDLVKFSKELCEEKYEFPVDVTKYAYQFKCPIANVSIYSVSTPQNKIIFTSAVWKEVTEFFILQDSLENKINAHFFS